MKGENRTAVYLTIKECEAFKVWRKYQDLWEEVFKVKDGSVKLNFDSEGKLQTVDYFAHKVINII